MVPKISYCRQDSSYTNVIDYGQIVKTEWELDKLISNSIPDVKPANLDLFAIRFSHNLPHVFPVLDNQVFAIDAFFTNWNSCLCISYENTNSFCPEQDTPISVQNEFYSSSLTVTNIVLRGSITTCLSSSSSSTFSRILTQANLPVLNRHAWELSRNQLRDRNFANIAVCVSKSKPTSTQKAYDTKCIAIGVIERRLSWSRPLFLL